VKQKRDAFGFLPMPFIDWEKIWLEPYAPLIPMLYEGHKGPVTFTGTPQEVVMKMRCYWKGLKS
jgi:hypothetical protein